MVDHALVTGLPENLELSGVEISSQALTRPNGPTL
jgi:hypothetical protein